MPLIENLSVDIVIQHASYRATNPDRRSKLATS